MKTNFYAKGIKLTEDLREEVEVHMQKIEQFLGEDAMEAWVELDDDKSIHGGTKKYRAEIQIKLQHGSLRAEETAENIIVAINGTLPKLKKQIEKFKTRFREVKREK